MSWAHAPVAGRRACRVDVEPFASTYRMTPPRLAVTVWSSAPGLYQPPTGFSRSGSPALPRRLAGSTDPGSTTSGPCPSLGFAAYPQVLHICGQICYPACVRTSRSAGASVGLSAGTSWVLALSPFWRASFYASPSTTTMRNCRPVRPRTDRPQDQGPLRGARRQAQVRRPAKNLASASLRDAQPVRI